MDTHSELESLTSPEHLASRSLWNALLGWRNIVIGSADFDELVHSGGLPGVVLVNSDDPYAVARLGLVLSDRPESCPCCGRRIVVGVENHLFALHQRRN
jgi:hypothetical protein